MATFNKKLAKDILEHSSKYWLIMRALFNHLCFMFAARPHLMATFEPFLLGFGTMREVRSLDAEIKLYKLETMLAEIIPKKYESFDMEYVSYQGAYVRTMTLVIVEGIIKNHLMAVKSGVNTP
jgi:hypothetical protein